MSSKNTFTKHGNEIHIYREGWDTVALTTFRNDYYDELTSVTWTEKDGYLVNNRLGLLHRYIMAKWYGEDMLSHMSEQGWIVDHMNNNGYDCRISNLEFLSTHHNVAKGQTVDVESEKIRQHLAMTLCKDFSTGYYQIHLGCNDLISLSYKNSNQSEFLAKLKFLYDCDYRIVINDANDILLNYGLYGQIDISKLHYIDWEYEFRKKIVLTDEEKECPIIERDGEYYLVVGNNAWIHSSAIKTGWVPTKKKVKSEET